MVWKESVLRSLSASPLMKHFFTPGGWHEYVKGVCWLMGSWLVYNVFARLALVPCWNYTFLWPKKRSPFLTSQWWIEVNLIVEWKLFAFSLIIFSSLFCLNLCFIGKTHRQYIFSRTAVQLPWMPRDFLCALSASVKSLYWTTRKAFFLEFFLPASPLVTSAFGQRSVGLQPTPRLPAAPKKNPLVTRVRFNTTLSQYLVSYSGHEDVSKSNVHRCSHGCSMGLWVVAAAKFERGFF